MNNTNEVAEARSLIDRFRLVGKLVREAENNFDSVDNVPYTTEDQLYQSITSVCTQTFGAKFETNPLIYSPSDQNIILNGIIGGLEGSRFTFKLNDSSGNGCYVWFDGLQLNEENIKKLNVIYSVYTNWKKELLTMSDIKPMDYKGTDGAPQ